MLANQDQGKVSRLTRLKINMDEINWSNDFHTDKGSVCAFNSYVSRILLVTQLTTTKLTCFTICDKGLCSPQLAELF